MSINNLRRALRYGEVGINRFLLWTRRMQASLNDRASASGSVTADAAAPTASGGLRSLITSLRWVKWLTLLLLALLAVGLIRYFWLSDAKVEYVTARATVGPITRTVTATGTVNPVLTIVVGSYVSGSIQQLFCDYNARVQAGQICAKIDPRPYQTIVDQNKAALALAKAQLEKDRASLVYAKTYYERLGKLAPMDAVSKDAIDNARNNYEQALAQIAYDEASIEQRKAALAASLVNLEYTNIVSPVKGTVVSRNVTMGQTVAASFQTPTLFLIARDLTKMQVDTNVSESDIGGVKPGNRVTFTIDTYPNRMFDGVVVQVRQSPQTVQNVVTYDVVVGVENSDLALKPGLTAAARIVIDERKSVLRVPDQALRYTPSHTQGDLEGSEPRVFVLERGKPVERRVKPGLGDDNFTEILEGLKPGEHAIVSEKARRASRVPQPRL